jgi:integration host factor subunit beta
MIWETVAKPTMIKADLIEEVSRVVEIPRRDAEVVVETILRSMVEALRAGDKVEIRGFGSFRSHQRSGRMGRNPKSGQAVAVPAKRIPFFKPSKDVRELISMRDKICYLARSPTFGEGHHWPGKGS